MNPIKYFILCVFAFLVSCSKNEKPVALFTLDRYESGNLDHVFDFKNISLKANSFDWDFGDGTVSNTIAPAHKYKRHGRYLVSLTAINSEGKIDKYSQEVLCGTLWINEVSFDAEELNIESLIDSDNYLFYFFGTNFSDTNAVVGSVFASSYVSLQTIDLNMGIVAIDENNQLYNPGYVFRRVSSETINIDESFAEKGFFEEDFTAHTYETNVKGEPITRRVLGAGIIRLRFQLEVRDQY